MNRDKAVLFGKIAAVAVIVAAMIYGVSPGDHEPERTPLKAVDKRKPMPPIRLAAIDGGTWDLAQHRGEVVLVNFWATWCGPCRTETPDLVEIYRKYRSRGFSIAGITMDDNPRSVVPPFVREYEVPYPILLPDAKFAMADAIGALPTSFLLDRQGRVARVYQGMVHAEVLEPDVEQLLGEGAVSQ